MGFYVDSLSWSFSCLTFAQVNQSCQRFLSVHWRTSTISNRPNSSFLYLCLAAWNVSFWSQGILLNTIYRMNLRCLYNAYDSGELSYHSVGKWRIVLFRLIPFGLGYKRVACCIVRSVSLSLQNRMELILAFCSIFWETMVLYSVISRLINFLTYSWVLLATSWKFQALLSII